jgi:hypothetical protein
MFGNLLFKRVHSFRSFMFLALSATMIAQPPPENDQSVRVVDRDIAPDFDFCESVFAIQVMRRQTFQKSTPQSAFVWRNKLVL